MGLSVQVHTQGLHAVADKLRDAATQSNRTIGDAFDDWAERVADVMREEIPKDTGETADSVTVQPRSRGGQHRARIGPTNVDERGRPVGFYLNYGAAGRPPDDFIGRTAARVLDDPFDGSGVLPL